MRLFHFSEEAGLKRFEPRPVRTPSARAAGREWLNGPLVWAIDAAHEALYLFPRDCPRVLIWATETTTAEDRSHWLGQAAMVAFVERAWIHRLQHGEIWRYHLPQATFEDLGDAGMWVSRSPVEPLGADHLTDLPGQLALRGVTLTPVTSLASLRQLWDTSLHASGIRLRNSASPPAQGMRGSDGL